MQHPLLTGKTALVTGSGRGIGRATAEALAQCGARVVVTARNREEIEAVAVGIRERGGDAIAVPADITDRKSIERLFDRADGVDVLVNNAGIVGPISPLADADSVEWRRNIDVNLLAVFVACRLALPRMLEHGWGHIINVSSGAARGTTPGWSAYSAAKAGVEAMTGVLAAEVAGSGVRVVAVRPGIVDTEMQAEIRSSSEAQFGRQNLERFRGYKERGQLRSPEDPAQLIVWLLSDEAVDYHGRVVAIDDPEIAARVGLQPMGR